MEYTYEITIVGKYFEQDWQVFEFTIVRWDYEPSSRIIEELMGHDYPQIRDLHDIRSIQIIRRDRYVP